MWTHINTYAYLGKATERTNKTQETGIPWFGLKEIIHGSRERKCHEAAITRG